MRVIDERRRQYQHYLGKDIKPYQWKQLLQDFNICGMSITTENLKYYARLKLISTKARLNKFVLTNHQKLTTLMREDKNLYYGDEIYPLFREVYPNFDQKILYREFGRFNKKFTQNEIYDKELVEKVALFCFIAQNRKESGRRKNASSGKRTSNQRCKSYIRSFEEKKGSKC